MIHLSARRMNGVPQCMGFIQNFILESFSLRHYQPLLELYYSFRILTETSDHRVTFSHSSVNMTHAFINLLSSHDLSPQGWHEGDVEQ
jgi:hypothetical protein